MDRGRGGFHERLGPDLAPLDLGCKRLVVQCRQIYLWSDAVRASGDASWRVQADHAFEFLKTHYWDSEHGGWFFSVKPDGAPNDVHKDLYGHAFVLFAAGHYTLAFGGTDALELAAKTAAVLDEKFKAPSPGGFLEKADRDWTPRPGPRVQNPHMHLAEAFLALYEATRDEVWMKRARSLIDLLLGKLVDPKTGAFVEFSDAAWKPHPEFGDHVEPGHLFEWAWLLAEYVRLGGDAAVMKDAKRMHAFAMAYGVDTEAGGAFDVVHRDGSVKHDTKRIWPQTERIKSHVAMGDLKGVEESSRFLLERYLRPDGTWNEHFDRGLGKLTNDGLPGTTGYHIFLALREALRVL